MVVKTSKPPALSQLDLPYLAFFVGLRVNELVLKRTAAEGFAGLRESHGYLIQHLIESERTITELARRMQVTQQAASKAVAELLALKILEVAPAQDLRAKRVRLSQRGWKCVRLARQVRFSLANRLIKVTGGKNYQAARLTLLTCLQALGGIERIRTRRVHAPR
jgi:DNA-binding MarR family transcriptional regulator